MTVEAVTLAFLSVVLLVFLAVIIVALWKIEAGSKAFYRSLTDRVTMPPRELFVSAEEYYATLLLLPSAARFRHFA